MLWVRTKDMIRKRAKSLMEHGVTQKAIASSMGMSTATFSRWVNEAENVKITNPTVPTTRGMNPPSKKNDGPGSRLPVRTPRPRYAVVFAPGMTSGGSPIG